MVATYHGDHFVMYKNTESLCCTPETNIVSQLYFIYKERRQGGRRKKKRGKKKEKRKERENKF